MDEYSSSCSEKVNKQHDYRNRNLQTSILMDGLERKNLHRWLWLCFVLRGCRINRKERDTLFVENQCWTCRKNNSLYCRLQMELSSTLMFACIFFRLFWVFNLKWIIGLNVYAHPKCCHIWRLSSVFISRYSIINSIMLNLFMWSCKFITDCIH